MGTEKRHFLSPRRQERQGIHHISSSSRLTTRAILSFVNDLPADVVIRRLFFPGVLGVLAREIWNLFPAHKFF